MTAATATIDRETIVATDTRLAELTAARHAADARVTSAAESIHRLIGESPRYVTRTRKEWPTSAEEAEAILLARIDTLRPWDQQSAQRTLERLAEARRDRAAAIAEATPLNDLYREHRWARFFLVPGGHIHASTACSTCRITTEFGWLPNLSGLTEADAVAEHGPLLCSVCFPSAPVEWTVGREKPAGCPGSGKAPTEGTYRRRGRSAYGRCPECDTTQIVTTYGSIRKHKPATA